MSSNNDYYVVVKYTDYKGRVMDYTAEELTYAEMSDQLNKFMSEADNKYKIYTESCGHVTLYKDTSDYQCPNYMIVAKLHQKSISN